jgi:RNA-directed DNA polymerase
MEEVCERANLKDALRRVQANKGGPGVDGMTVDDLTGYLKQHWPTSREQLLNGTYEPHPVRRVEILNRTAGCEGSASRRCWTDSSRAVMLVRQRQWDRTFSDNSCGFRPGRSARNAWARIDRSIWELPRSGLVQC